MVFPETRGLGLPMVLPSLLRRSLLLLMLSTALGARAQDAALPQQSEKTSEGRYEWEVMTGVLWKVGGGATPLSYALLPQIVSLKIPPLLTRSWAGGTMVLRSRFSFLLEPIITGPETVYLGVAAAGELEWHHPTNGLELFFASGGGFGWMDSRGYEIAGAQGQDFNLNWLIHSGVRYRTASGWRWSAGVYFQHISNRGMDAINPGLNALGPTLGLSRRF
jgi:hypothetical protein